MTTREAQKFVSNRIARYRAEGVREDIAVAKAFSDARERGFRVPPAPHSPEKRP